MQILHHPDPFLSQVAHEVVDFYGLKDFVDQMAEIMYVGKGVGLAAPQVGNLRRIVIVDPSNGDSALAMRTMVNPVIEFFSPEKVLGGEGCLSIPGVEVIIARSSLINVKFQNIDGTTSVELLSGLEARIVQHEIDHLNGITLLNHVNRKKRK